MRIRMLVRQAGLSHEPGDERDVPAAEGRALIDAGQAELVAQSATDVVNDLSPARKVTKRRGGKATETAAVAPPAERRG